MENLPCKEKLEELGQRRNGLAEWGTPNSYPPLRTIGHQGDGQGRWHLVENGETIIWCSNWLQGGLQCGYVQYEFY